MTSEHIPAVVKVLTERFEAQTVEFRDQVSLLVDPDKIVDVCQTLRDELGFETLSAESAVDYWPQQAPRFHLIYWLYSYEHKCRIGLRVPLNGDALTLPSVEVVYPNANWYERELWDMFGIRFEGHTDLRRILMPYDWVGHPLRKDYPLGYEEVQYSFNYDEIDARKRYAKD